MRKNSNVQSRTLIVGILTTEGKQTALTGNFKLFRDISKRLAEKGGTTIVFTLSSFQDNAIKGGYIYNQEKKGWTVANYTGMPDVIYNRIPYRKDENTEQFHKFTSWCQKNDVPMFNCSFFKKWDLYTALLKDSKLKNHLPFTQLIHSKEQLEQHLHEHSSLYLKPNDGSKGNGIYILSKQEDHNYHIKGHNGMYGSTFFQNIWEKKINPLLLRKEYIFQYKTEIMKHNERSYDYRVFAHNVKKNWVVSGIGIRQGKMNGITTHVLKGGNVMEIDDVTQPEDVRQIHYLTKRCGDTLEKAFGVGCIKEFSMDIGKSTDGEFYIFDVNSKPMKFDEPDIYENGLNNLSEIFLEYSK